MTSDRYSSKFHLAGDLEFFKMKKSPLKTDLAVLLYLPNLIGYARLVIIFIAHHLRNEPSTAALLYLIFALLDGIDGWVARRLNQCSAFGAWLDVIVDNIGRTMIWSTHEWGFLISNIEWITFICNYQYGPSWKEAVGKALDEKPKLVNKVMENGFKTPIGILAILGLHGLPIWMFCWNHHLLESLFNLPGSTLLWGYVMLVAGRSLCLTVECWCILNHIKCLLSHKNE